MRPFIPKIPISSIQPSPSATSHLPPPQLNFKFDPTMVSTRGIVYCNVRCCFNLFFFIYLCWCFDYALSVSFLLSFLFFHLSSLFRFSRLHSFLFSLFSLHLTHSLTTLFFFLLPFSFRVHLATGKATYTYVTIAHLLCSFLFFYFSFYYWNFHICILTLLYFSSTFEFIHKRFHDCHHWTFTLTSENKYLY